MDALADSSTGPFSGLRPGTAGLEFETPVVSCTGLNELLVRLIRGMSYF